MLERKILDRLKEWKSRGHSSLVIKGQRQVGKTFIVRRFGEESYEHFVELNLDANPTLRSAFDDDRNVDAILMRLEVLIGSEDLVPGSTLLFLDEIQSCPKAYSSLKAFTMDGRFDVIASGSLLGVDQTAGDNQDALQPVGYVEHMTMYSLDFEEFVWSRGISRRSVDFIRESIASKHPLGDAILSRMNSLFHEFMAVGGMPAAVQMLSDTNSLDKAGKVISDIIEECKRDINRYTDANEKGKTLECFLSIPSQLAETNTRFEYSRISGGKSRKSRDTYHENLLWIKDAGYGNFCYALTEPSMPLEHHANRKLFRIYMSDTGMLTHMSDDRDDLVRELVIGGGRYNIGYIMENVVAECLMKCGKSIYYYIKRSGKDMMELDFVISMNGRVGVIEVKPGKDRTAPSIRKSSQYFDIGRRIMFENGDIQVDPDGIEHYPLFAAAFLDSMLAPKEDLTASPPGDLPLP